MSRTFYENINKLDILSNPSKYAWNCVLYYVQFSQEEILSVKEWIEVRELIKFQKSVTTQFLREHFQKEIDDCLEVDWNDVKKYVNN
jgi:hypothetical protein